LGSSGIALRQCDFSGRQTAGDPVGTVLETFDRHQNPVPGRIGNTWLSIDDRRDSLIETLATRPRILSPYGAGSLVGMELSYERCYSRYSASTPQRRMLLFLKVFLAVFGSAAIPQVRIDLPLARCESASGELELIVPRTGDARCAPPASDHYRHAIRDPRKRCNLPKSW